MNYREHLHGGQTGHYDRYVLSANWLEPFLTAGAKVAECGAEDGVFTRLLRECFPAVEVTTIGETIDLRYRFADRFPPQDLVLAMEVIEHMKDRSEDDRATFCYSGVKNLLAECFLLLRPGGTLFLSTPNPASYGCLWTQMRGDCPQWFKPHPRELGPLELRWLLEYAGFRIEAFHGVNVWPPQECPAELRKLADRLSPDIPRESCLFILARKPL